MGVWRLLRVTFACLLLALAVSTVHAQELYFIDAHSQVDHDVDAKTIIANMNAAGVRRSILSVRNRSPKFVIQLSKQYPEQLVPPVTTKMWGYIFDSKKPHKKYYKALQGQVRSGKFRAMSEVLMVHSGCPKDKCPSVRVRPDDRRVTAALAAAVAKGWPFVAHIEFSSLSYAEHQDFMASFKAMLGQWPCQSKSA